MSVKELQIAVAAKIAKAKIEDAFQILHDWANIHGSNNTKMNLNMIEADWSLLKQDRIRGVLSSEEALLRSNQINQNILQFQWTTVDPELPKTNPVKEVVPQNITINIENVGQVIHGNETNFSGMTLNFSKNK